MMKGFPPVKRAQLRFAVVGVGHLGRHHARILAQIPDVELAYVVDIRSDRARSTAAMFGGIPLEDYRAIPLDAIDAVSIVTPTTTHEEIATYFIDHGVPTFVEKPLAATARQGASLARRAEARGVPLFVGHIERFNPAFQYLKSHLQPMCFIEITRVHPFVPRSTDVDIVTDLMIHDLDLLLCLVGPHLRIMDAVGVPVVTGRIDAASVRLEWPGGRANLVASRVSRVHMRRWNIFSEGRYLMADFQHREVSIIRLDYNNPLAFTNRDFRLRDFGEPLDHELRAFVSTLREGRPTSPDLTDAASAVHALQFVESILRSIHEDRMRELSPWVASPVSGLATFVT